MSKYYYSFKETGKLWKQNKPLKENPSEKYHLLILNKSEYLNLKSSKMAKDKKKKKKKEEKKSPSSGSSSSQVVRKLDGSIALSKLKHVIMKKKGKKSKIKCIVIPIKENFLIEGKDGAVYMNVRINLKDKEDDYKQHGFVSQQVPSEIYKAASEEEKEEMKRTPILGGLKDWEFSATSNDSTGKAGEDIDEEDDLPF